MEALPRIYNPFPIPNVNNVRQQQLHFSHAGSNTNIFRCYEYANDPFGES